MNQIHERLLAILERLPSAQAQQLLDYAEFLSVQYGTGETTAVPHDIARPAEESVVLAIKRLRATYPMLDPAKLLNETYELMSQHTLRGRAAVEVIDELELVFRRHYERLTEGGDR